MVWAELTVPNGMVWAELTVPNGMVWTQQTVPSGMVLTKLTVPSGTAVYVKFVQRLPDRISNFVLFSYSAN